MRIRMNRDWKSRDEYERIGKIVHPLEFLGYFDNLEEFGGWCMLLDDDDLHKVLTRFEELDLFEECSVLRDEMIRRNRQA